MTLDNSTRHNIQKGTNSFQNDMNCRYGRDKEWMILFCEH